MLGANGLLKVVRLGIQRAKPYGLTNPGLLRLYVDIMFKYGSFFDTDPCLPWASEVLRDDSIQDDQARADRLYDRMLQYYRTISGVVSLQPASLNSPLELRGRAVFDRQALHNCDRVFIEDCLPDHPTFEGKLINRLFEVHSRRAGYLGEERMQGLVQRAIAAALRLNVNTADGVSLVAFLMFTKGHGFAEDPILPWAKAALGEEVGQDHWARVKRLERDFFAYREQVFAPID